ncbi:MAG: hypothetical protein E7452_07510 [Ruminococcaceae bacterium]|nr:hypothetical protein [Oscillospiraceae bacterium]
MTLEFLFSAVWEMSLTGTIVICVVVLVRLCLKRLPKTFSYALWAVVLFRLLCPVSLTSPVSLFSVVKPLELPGAAKTERVLVEYFDSVPKDRLQTTYPSSVIVGDKFFTYPITAPTPIEKTETFAFETVWLVGIAVSAVWGIVSSLRLRRRLVGSVDAGGRVRLADHIDTPFVFGLFRPKIYLPSELDLGKQPYILCHEQYHIRRGDHVWRFLAYAALCIHWFNPLVWLAFYLSGKDMEMSCDEAVVRRMGADVRADYSASLLAFGTSLRSFSASPIAFGEGSTKGRIKNLLRWKNPALWLILVAIVLCAVVAVVCLVDPQSTGVFGYDYDVTEIVFDHGFFSSTYTSIATTPEYRVDESGVLWVKERKIFDHTIGGWQAVGELTPVVLTAENFVNGFGPLNWRNTSVSAEGLLADNRRAWVVKTEGSGLSYYLLEQIDGKLYLACWYDRNDYDAVEGLGDSEVLVRWLFSVERAGEISGSAYKSDEHSRYTIGTWLYQTPGLRQWVAYYEFHVNPVGVLYRRVTFDGYAPEEWEPLGVLKKTTIEPEVLKNAFIADVGWQNEAVNAETLLAENRTVWGTSFPLYENENQWVSYLNYYLFEQKNGEHYLMEWFDATPYTREDTTDPIMAQYLLGLRKTAFDEPEEILQKELTQQDLESLEHDSGLTTQTTSYATVSSPNRRIVRTMYSGRLRFSGDVAKAMYDELEFGSEILFTYIGGVRQSDPGQLERIARVEKIAGPSAIASIPTEFEATIRVYNWLEGYFTLEVTDDVIPDAEHVLVFSSLGDLAISSESYQKLQTLQFPQRARFTTDGTVYRYDRTNGVTEYRIEPITVELIETQP